MRTLIPLIAALALAACQPQAPDGSLAQPPADAPPVSAEPAPPPAAPALPAAFQGDIDAHGTEPFWAVEIRQTQISFKTPEASIVFPAGGMAVADGAAVWESTAGDKPIKITLREQPGCSDGMSDLTYPLAAEVALGGTTYKGCASKTAEKPKEGG
ncbi:COG3650 family protein [Phenylobacterium sp.]|uniref:COG3650 family protein n=1 Tax=Phenylobacterium sp. TaxID=1871053 RepID=UPI0035B05EAF